MSIGNTGKRARKMGQAQQQRYTMQYRGADKTPLKAPAEAENNQIQRVPDVPEVLLSSPEPIQREETETSVLNTAPTSPPARSAPTPVDPKAVADRVYKLMMRDRRLDRERFGR